MAEAAQDTESRHRSRRALLGGGMFAAAAALIGRGRAEAATGGAMILGKANAASTSTALTTTGSGIALQVTQTGSSAAALFKSLNSNGFAGGSSSPNAYGLSAANYATTTGIGAAMAASGGNNDGMVANTNTVNTLAVSAANLVLNGTAVDAFATIGVIGETPDGNGAGVIGSATDPAGTAIVAQGPASPTTGLAISATGNVQVQGNVNVSGTLSKGAGTFKIDHPLDPANKFLLHSFVESPDMKNVYDGVATLDAGGAATVSLPDWFGALNRDFRYQLTAIGAAMPSLHVASEVAGNRFAIGGGLAGAKVSWQVTGIRQDAFANAHRIQVEQDKSAAERGHYLHPAEHGQPASRLLAGTPTDATRALDRARTRRADRRAGANG